MPVFLKSPLHLWSVEICEASWWCLGQESTTFLWSHNGKTKHRWRTWCGGFEVEKKTCWTKNTYSWDIRVSSVKWLWHLSHFQGGWTSINRLYFVKNIHKFQLFWCELQVFFSRGLEPLPKRWHDDEARSGWVQLLPNKKLSTTWCIGSLPEGGALNCWLSWCTWL